MQRAHCLALLYITPNYQTEGSLKCQIACSAGGFGGFRLSIFRVFSCHYEFAADRENWGKNERMSEGVGRGRKNKFFFPLPFPNFSFSLPRLVNFLPHPNSPLFFNSRWQPEHPMGISTCPAKIHLHCRLSVK